MGSAEQVGCTQTDTPMRMFFSGDLRCLLSCLVGSCGTSHMRSHAQDSGIQNPSP